jgi:hypothetical protein
MERDSKPPISHVMIWKKKKADGEQTQPIAYEAAPPKKVGLARQLQLLAIQHNSKIKRNMEEGTSED